MFSGIIQAKSKIISANKWNFVVENNFDEILEIWESIAHDGTCMTIIDFDTEKYNINAKSQETLNKLIGIFKEYPNTNVLVEGHTDNTGSESYNLTLSKNRAQAVTNYLVNNGLSSGRFDTKWYGESQPKYDNTTAEGRAKNRRVELAIVANETMKEEAKQATSEE